MPCNNAQLNTKTLNVFLGQFQMSALPKKNYLRYHEPHLNKELRKRLC